MIRVNFESYGLFWTLECKSPAEINVMVKGHGPEVAEGFMESLEQPALGMFDSCLDINPSWDILEMRNTGILGDSEKGKLVMYKFTSLALEEVKVRRLSHVNNLGHIEKALLLLRPGGEPGFVVLNFIDFKLEDQNVKHLRGALGVLELPKGAKNVCLSVGLSPNDEEPDDVNSEDIVEGWD